MNKNFKIIAETAFSHEGNFKYLMSQIEEAKKGQVDFIKFQVLIDEEGLCTKNHDSFKNINNWIIEKDKWLKALLFAKKQNLKAIVLPLTLNSLEFLNKHENLIYAYEIHSICLNEIHLLNMLYHTAKKIILGIGGQLPSDIKYALDTLDIHKNKIILMYGFQSFPTKTSKINLNKIKSFSNMFHCHMGYADHTKFNDSIFYNLIEYAYILKARFFEKHIVLEKGEKRVDYESAITANEFIEMRKRINRLINIIGDGDILNLNIKEINYRNRKKQIVAASNIKKNRIINLKNLAYKLTTEKSDFEQKEIHKIIGRKCHRSLSKDESIKYKDID
ncbi:MAG: N-acetylneuraminate synthase family protein [Candidatus Odinarchaeota archaeon]